MRKVFLDNLPRYESGTYKGKINWKDSVGYNVKFIYDDIEGSLEIMRYNTSNSKCRIKYNDFESEICANHLKKSKIGTCIGKIKKEYIYKIGDTVQDVNSGKLKILELIRMKQGKSTQKGYKYKCLVCGNIDTITEGNISNKRGCNVCCKPSKKILTGYNDLWTTQPNIANLLKNKEKGFNLSSGSGKKEIFICSICKHEKKAIVYDVVVNGISCKKCSDGKSYPEKFMTDVLNQLKANFETEKTFEWSKNTKRDNLKLKGNKRYDFFISTLNCIIETHGIQHYVEKTKNSNYKKTLKEEQENDKLKKQLAKENGIDHYIVVDCRKSELEWIKNNVLNSKLNELFDLSDVDWLKCHEFALNSLVKEACILWNNTKNTYDIALKMNLNSHTICRYLKQGVKLGWCDYNPKKVMNEVYSNSKIGEISKRKVVQLSFDGNYIQTWNSIIDAEKQLEITSISSACVGKDKKSAGGYMWMYYEDYLKNKNNIKPYKRTYYSVKAIQLSLENEFIKEWNSLEEACNFLNIHKGDISNCLKNNDGINNPRSSGGYLWYKKRTYEKYKDSLKKYIRYKRKYKQIVQLRLNGEYVRAFQSISEASNILNTSSSNISMACKGKRNTAQGSRFMYYDEYIKLENENKAM